MVILMACAGTTGDPESLLCNGYIITDHTAKIICYMRCVNTFFIDYYNKHFSDFSCHLNQKDALRIPDECLCVILTGKIVYIHG